MTTEAITCKLSIFNNKQNDNDPVHSTAIVVVFWPTHILAMISPCVPMKSFIRVNTDRFILGFMIKKQISVIILYWPFVEAVASLDFYRTFSVIRNVWIQQA